MSDADTLRSLAATAAAAADALDENPRLHATISGLEATRDQLAAQVADLQAQLAARTTRFPGDPGPGRLWWGAAVGGNASPAAHETATGRPLPIRRRYYTSSQWGTTGALVKAAAEDHAAGRLPWLSFKTDWAQAAAGKLDGQFDALLRTLDALGKPVWLIVNHEPENDGGNAAQWRALQQRVRARMTAVGTRNISFGGCLMSWTWDPRSGRNPADWWPGGDVWDWLGADHYTETKDPVDQACWRNWLAFCGDKKIPPALPEWGVRREDPQAATKITRMYELSVASGVVGAAYFDSNLNSTGSGWSLSGAGLDAFHALAADPRSAYWNGQSPRPGG